jgi:hypothetical protein
MKQTAVEWLAEKYNEVNWLRNRDEISSKYADELREGFLNQAKEMEKQQIQDAYRISPNNELWSNSGIDYYEKTFKSQIYVDATPNDIDRGPR